MTNTNKAFLSIRYRRSYMEMVKLESMEDWRNLPLNKDEVKQPRFSEQRENALETGRLFIYLVIY